jgi:fatty aldehyde-generating acyl-ACP reductase
LQKFGFIIHPIDVKDIARKFSAASKVPDHLIEKVLPLVPAFTTSHITGVQSLAGAEAEGWFVSVPLTPRLMMEQLPEAKVMKRIISAGQKAAEQGAKIVGLGAFTSVVGDAGITIANNLDIAVTTGNTFTAATALMGIEYAAQRLETDLTKQTIAVLGASGSIGKVCARVLAQKGMQLTLVARDRGRLEELARLIREESGNDVSIETDLPTAVRSAGVVVAVTSAMEAVIDAADIRPGAIVCDVSRPRNVSKTVARQRQDVLVFEGGVVAVPGPVDFGLNFGFPPGTSYACMAETMILALEGRYENYSLGRDLDVAKVHEISALARKHGFKLAGLRSFESAVPDTAFDRVKAHLHQQKRRTFPLEEGSVGKAYGSKIS